MPRRGEGAHRAKSVSRSLSVVEHSVGIGRGDRACVGHVQDGLYLLPGLPDLLGRLLSHCHLRIRYGTGNGNDAQPYTTGFIFKLTHGKRLNYSYSQVFDFPSCTNGFSNCPNGYWPILLAVGQSGALYVLAHGGNSTGEGVLLKISPGGGEQVLYEFCSVGGDACSDGAEPLALTYSGAAAGKDGDETSPLYGIASGGGNAHSAGTVFKYDPGTENSRPSIAFATTSLTAPMESHRSARLRCRAVISMA